MEGSYPLLVRFASNAFCVGFNPLVKFASNAYCLTFEQWTPLSIAREIRLKRFLRIGFKAEPYP
jgi:hypothetical protein